MTTFSKTEPLTISHQGVLVATFTLPGIKNWPAIKSYMLLKGYRHAFVAQGTNAWNVRLSQSDLLIKSEV